MPQTVANGGSYLIELEASFNIDAFQLDSALYGVLDVNVIGGTTGFTDITQFTESFSIRRGRQKLTDQFPTGTATIVFNDSLSGQDLNPFNTTSPYYDTANSQPGLSPLRQMRISRDGQFLFKGRIQTYDVQYVLGGQDTVTVTCADNMFVLAQTELDAFTPAAQTSSARITTVLARPEVAYTGATSLTASPVATLGAYAVANGTTTANYLNQIQQAERGRLFCNRENTLVFQPRITSTFFTAAAKFKDDGTGVPYKDLDIDYDSTDVVNRASITRVGGVSQVASNAASIARYYTQAQNETDSLLSTDAQALTLATYLIVPNPIPRFTAIETYFGALTEAQRDIVSVIDIGNVITITSTESFGTVEKSSFVEGVEISVNAETGQTMRFYTSPATLLYYFILDDPIQGVLGVATPQPLLS